MSGTTNAQLGTRITTVENTLVTHGQTLDDLKKGQRVQGEHIASIQADLGNLSGGVASINAKLDNMGGTVATVDATKGMIPIPLLLTGGGLFLALVGTGITALTLFSGGMKEHMSHNADKDNLKLQTVQRDIQGIKEAMGADDLRERKDSATLDRLSDSITTIGRQTDRNEAELTALDTRLQREMRDLDNLQKVELKDLSALLEIKYDALRTELDLKVAMVGDDTAEGTKAVADVDARLRELEIAVAALTTQADMDNKELFRRTDVVEQSKADLAALWARFGDMEKDIEELTSATNRSALRAAE